MNYDQQVIVKDLKTFKHETRVFDAIFVCNGRNNTPNWPKPRYLGADIFKGSQIHSHDFRRADRYRSTTELFEILFFIFTQILVTLILDKNVLIIGYGPSGVDLTYIVSETAKNVYLSHHAHSTSNVFPKNVEMMPSVQMFDTNSVIFTDDEEREIDDIIYCTGYKVVFPFLSVDCGISVDENYINPLFKHIININYPTMYFIGMTSIAAITQMVDIQVQYAMQFINGNRRLPSKEDMKADTEHYAGVRWNSGFPKKAGHSLAQTLQRDYYHQLATEGGINNVREVYVLIYEDSSDRRKNHLADYRNDLYHIIDDNHFERTSIDLNKKDD